MIASKLAKEAAGDYRTMARTGLPRKTQLARALHIPPPTDPGNVAPSSSAKPSSVLDEVWSRWRTDRAGARAHRLSEARKMTQRARTMIESARPTTGIEQGLLADARILLAVNQFFIPREESAEEGVGASRSMAEADGEGATNESAVGLSRVEELRGDIEALRFAAAQNYSNGRAWFWHAFLTGAVIWRLGSNVVDGHPRRPFISITTSGHWHMEEIGVPVSRGVPREPADPIPWRKALRETEEATGVPVQRAWKDIEGIFDRVFHPSYRLFHVAVWAMAFTSNKGFGTALLARLKQGGILGSDSPEKFTRDILDQLQREWARSIDALDGADAPFPDTNPAPRVRSIIAQKDPPPWNAHGDWPQKVAPWILMPHPGLFGIDASNFARLSDPYTCMGERVNADGPFWPPAYLGVARHARRWATAIQFVPLYHADRLMHAVFSPPTSDKRAARTVKPSGT